MFHPLVSIVIPVYNGANYLREAIDSALGQTYDNCEVLVINDGSIDDRATEKIALSYGEKIRYFAKPNGGVGSALNLGIEQMRGEYFSWLSHDDVYLPEKVERQVDHLSTLQDRNVFIFSDYILVDAKMNELFTFRGDNELLKKKPLYAVFRVMINGCTTLIPKKSLLEAGFFRNLPCTQDYEMWFRLSRILPFQHMPLPLIYSRQHDNQGCLAKRAEDEGNDLWIKLISGLDEKEILSMEQSRELFFHKMVDFFMEKQIHLQRAIVYMCKQLPNGMLKYYIYCIKTGVILKNSVFYKKIKPFARKIKGAFCPKRKSGVF